MNVASELPSPRAVRSRPTRFYHSSEDAVEGGPIPALYKERPELGNSPCNGCKTAGGRVEGVLLLVTGGAVEGGPILPQPALGSGGAVALRVLRALGIDAAVEESRESHPSPWSAKGSGMTVPAERLSPYQSLQKVAPAAGGMVRTKLAKESRESLFLLRWL